MKKILLILTVLLVCILTSINAKAQSNMTTSKVGITFVEKTHQVIPNDTNSNSNEKDTEVVLPKAGDKAQTFLMIIGLTIIAVLKCFKFNKKGRE